MLKALLLLLFPIYILASDVQEQGDVDKMQLFERELDNMRKEITTLREELKKNQKILNPPTQIQTILTQLNQSIL